MIEDYKNVITVVLYDYNLTVNLQISLLLYFHIDKRTHNVGPFGLHNNQRRRMSSSEFQLSIGSKEP